MLQILSLQGVLNYILLCVFCSKSEPVYIIILVRQSLRKVRHLIGFHVCTHTEVMYG